MRKKIKDKIKQYMEDNDNGEVSPPFLWDACKVVLRGRIIAKTGALKKNKQQELINLEGKLEGLQRKHKKNIGSKYYKRNATIKISNKYYSDTRHIQKQKYYEVGSKSTKLLAYKLKKQQAERSIYKIRDPHDNTIKYDLDDICESFVSYYKNLYTQPILNNEEQADSLLGGLDLPVVSESQNEVLKAPVTSDELKRAISRLKTNKSPGPDGYTAEW